VNCLKLLNIVIKEHPLIVLMLRREIKKEPVLKHSEVSYTCCLPRTQSKSRDVCSFCSLYTNWQV